jgi:hypothetical protein
VLFLRENRRRRGKCNTFTSKGKNSQFPHHAHFLRDKSDLGIEFWPLLLDERERCTGIGHPIGR